MNTDKKRKRVSEDDQPAAGVVSIPPWMSHFLIVTMILTLCVATTLHMVLSFYVPGPFEEKMILFCGWMLVGALAFCIPNFLILQGHDLLGIKILKIVSLSDVLITLPSFYFIQASSGQVVVDTLISIATVIGGLLSYWILVGIKYQVFAYFYKDRWDQRRKIQAALGELRNK